MPGSNDIVRFDLATSRYGDPIELGSRPSDLIYEGGAIWAIVRDRLVRVDVVTQAATRPLVIEEPLEAAHAGGGLLWLTAAPSNTDVIAFDPWTQRVVGIFELDGVVRDVIGDGTAVWVLTGTSVTRIQIRP